MVTRDFDAMLAERAGVRPTFRVAGQTFTVKAKLNFRKFSKMLSALGADDTDENEAMDEFFRMVLIPQDRDRFFELLDSDDEDESKVVGADQMRALSQWLMEHYTGKPQTSEESSSDGSASAGESPNVVSLNSRTQTA